MHKHSTKNVRAYTHNASTHTRTHAHTRARTHARTHTHTHTHTNYTTHTCACTHMHVQYILCQMILGPTLHIASTGWELHHLQDSIVYVFWYMAEQPVTRIDCRAHDSLVTSTHFHRVQQYSIKGH